MCYLNFVIHSNDFQETLVCFQWTRGHVWNEILENLNGFHSLVSVTPIRVDKNIETEPVWFIIT